MSYQPTDRSAFLRPAFVPLAGIALGISALIFGLQSLGVLQLFEWAVLDVWFRRRPVEHYTTESITGSLETAQSQAIPVAIVAIDDNDIATSQQWPMSDGQLADFLTLIKQHQPAAIGLDLYKDLSIEPGRDRLQAVFSTTPTLIGIEKVVSESASGTIGPPPALQAVNQVGFNDLVLDGDGHMRRHLISLRQDEQTKFALGTTLALAYLETNFDIVPQPLNNSRIQLGKARFSPLRPNAGGYSNADVGGYQILANYLRLTDGIPTVSMQDVLNNRLEPGTLTGKIVFIGTKAESSRGDLFYTPFSQSSDESWSGVELHANLTAQLLASALYGRSPLVTLPEFLEWTWILLWAGMGVSCHRVLSTHWRWWLYPIALAIALMVTTYLLFLSAYWLPLVAPLLGFGSAWLSAQGYVTWHRLRQDNQRLEFIVEQRTQALRSQNKTLEKAQIAAEVANQAKSNFLAHITHELRTPLTAILGFGELLQYSPNLPAQEKEYVDTINQGGEHLLTLINNVLELSKIEAATLELNTEATHLSALLDNIHKLFQAQANAKQIALNFEIDPALPTWIEIDSEKLRQVLINLLGNALKFTSAGSVTLEVHNSQVQNSQAHENAVDISFAAASNHSVAEGTASVAHSSQPIACPTETIAFCVSDTGPGLRATEIEQLFQPFVQTTAGKALGSGSGLGLTLAKQCVELMGGTLNVTSTYGQGSQFSFQLSVTPARPLVTDPPIAIATSYALPQAPSDYRILIVDDEANNRRLLSQWLTDANFDVQTAASGENALQAFSDWQPHLILLDIHLPDLDGYEVARQIREQWPEDDEPVILAITAGVLQDDYTDVLSAGCDDILWKPIKAETLLSKLAEYL
ncbi:MAG: CHASE2 domain-containing protein [Cyanobacteria bacterium P01_A01_bin.116]